MVVTISLTLADSVISLGQLLHKQDYLKQFMAQVLEFLQQASGPTLFDVQARFWLIGQINRLLVTNLEDTEYEYHYFVFPGQETVNVHLVIDVLPDLPQLKSDQAKALYVLYSNHSTVH